MGKKVLALFLFCSIAFADGIVDVKSTPWTSLPSDLIPSTTCTYDLGSSSLEWKDAFFNGTVTGVDAIFTGTGTFDTVTLDDSSFEVDITVGGADGTFRITNATAPIIQMHSDVGVNVFKYENADDHMQILPGASKHLDFFEDAVSGETPRARFYGWPATGGFSKQYGQFQMVDEGGVEKFKISSNSGEITFVDENLTTTGNINIGTNAPASSAGQLGVDKGSFDAFDHSSNTDWTAFIRRRRASVAGAGALWVGTQWDGASANASAIQGLNAIVFVDGAGNLTGDNTIGGKYGVRNRNSSQTIAKATGVLTELRNDDTFTGTITSAREFVAGGVHAHDGTVTNAINFLGNAHQKDAGGTLTNAYGMYLNEQTVGATKNYQIYSTGGDTYWGSGTHDWGSGNLTTSGTGRFDGGIGVNVDSIGSGIIRVDRTGTAATIIANRTDGKSLAFVAGGTTSNFRFDNSASWILYAQPSADILSGGSSNLVTRLEVESDGDFDFQSGRLTTLGGASIGSAQTSYTLKGSTQYIKAYIKTDAGGTDTLAMQKNSDSALSAPSAAFLRRRATGGDVHSGDRVGTFGFRAHDGTDYNQSASFGAFVDGAVSSNTVPMRLEFSTSPTNSATVRMTIDSAGDIDFVAGNIITTGTLGSNDIEIKDDTPHLRFWDTDNNITYEWHLDPEDTPYQNFGLWRGVSGDVSPNIPLMYFDNNNDVFFYDDITTTGIVGTPQIKTDTVTPTDLTITTGAAKTLVLATAVYKDINMAGYLLTKPASSAPDTVTFVDEGGVDTTIETYGFAVDQKVHGGFELQHDYKEGTDLVFHVHWQGIAAPSVTDNVQWRLKYIVMRGGATLDAAVVIDSPDTAIDTQYKTYKTDFGAITGTNFLIEDQLMFTLTRVAATGDVYLGDALIGTAGIHYQVDTIGSRAIATK